MQLNHKLTRLLKGRTIQSESGDEGHVAIAFDDQSTLKLRISGQATVSVGAKVEAVHEAGERFQVDLAEGASAGTSSRSRIVGGVARQKRRSPIHWLRYEELVCQTINPYHYIRPASNFAKMLSAVAVHWKGLGSWLCSTM